MHLHVTGGLGGYDIDAQECSKGSLGACSVQVLGLGSEVLKMSLLGPRVLVVLAAPWGLDRVGSSRGRRIRICDISRVLEGLSEVGGLGGDATGEQLYTLIYMF